MRETQDSLQSRLPNSIVDPVLPGETHDFSLVLGGPLYQLLRKSHLQGDETDLLHRRLLAITLGAWLPLLLLSLIPHPAIISRLDFLHDIEVHVRFLVSLPILIAAELIVHMRVRAAVRSFVERRIVLPEDVPLFDRALASAIGLRNSIPVEFGVVLFVYASGLFLWGQRFALQEATWFSVSGRRWDLTPAGYWYVFVSLPILQFILLRWYVRLFIWFRFLWQVSRLKLGLIPTHPDRAAGLGFLGKSSYAFGPILFAQGGMLAGLLAARVLYGGQSLLSFKLQVGGFVAFFVCAILAPLLMFTPAMAAAKRKGLAEYGLLAQRYVESFAKKWVPPDAQTEELLGSGDIQSLADLGNSYSVIREMRPVPFGLDDISRLAAATAAPMVPLLLTIFSPEELIMRIINVVF
jgi:hypothetical protein